MADEQTSPLKPLRYDTMKHLDAAIKEAAEITKEAAANKQQKSCEVYIDINGEVFKYGDFPEPTIEKYKRPPNSVCVFSTYVDIDNIYDKVGGFANHQNWRVIDKKYEYYGRYTEEFDCCRSGTLKAKVDKWIKKNREKVHHVNLPMAKRIQLNRMLLDDRLNKIEKVITPLLPYTRSGLNEALAAIKDIQNHMRSLEKEFKLQLEATK